MSKVEKKTTITFNGLKKEIRLIRLGDESKNKNFHRIQMITGESKKERM